MISTERRKKTSDVEIKLSVKIKNVGISEILFFNLNFHYFFRIFTSSGKLGHETAFGVINKFRGRVTGAMK